MSRRPEEIEGSNARADDRGRPDGFGFFAEPTPNEARYLGDPADVTEIIREYLSGVHEIRVKAFSGALNQDAAFAELEALAARYQAIFLGRDKAYRSMPFNSPAGVGAFIKALYPSDDTNEEAVKTYLLHIANAILEAEAKYQADEIEADVAEFTVATTIEDAQRALMGIPYDPSEE